MTGQRAAVEAAVRPAELDQRRAGLPCREQDPERWFPEGRRLAADNDYAARLCAGCPVRRACLEYALAAREPYGVWGGVSEAGRTALLRNQRQQRYRAGRQAAVAS